MLPGVGAAGTPCDRSNEAGLIEPIHEVVDRGTPFLGVCLGMQLLFGHQEEGDAKGLGLLKGSVRIDPGRGKAPPHWLEPIDRSPKPLPGTEPATRTTTTSSIRSSSNRHDPADVAAPPSMANSFASVVVRDNVWGTQFHPEKSSDDGLALVNSWVETVRTSCKSSEVASR